MQRFLPRHSFNDDTHCDLTAMLGHLAALGCWVLERMESTELMDDSKVKFHTTKTCEAKFFLKDECSTRNVLFHVCSNTTAGW